MRQKLHERFWGKVLRRGPNECWEWMGARHDSRGGYGRFTIGNSKVRAHRLSFALTYGDFPPNLIVMHSCDNPPCVNPAHLHLGTQGDNMRDRTVKGRTRGVDKTHCNSGHEFTDTNTYRTKRGTRSCRECHRLASFALRAKRKAAA